MIEIESCGPLCTIQDGGRVGWRRIGLPRSGALDPMALAVANCIVGNSAETPAVELFMAGISLRTVRHPVRMALAGADMHVTCDGVAIASHRSFVLYPGEKLVVGTARRGAVGVLAIEGGFLVPLVLGSASLHVRSGVGSRDGRPLRPGDRVPAQCASLWRREREVVPLGLEAISPIRVVLGPQDWMFNAAAIESLTSSRFRITHECDRMAYRLTGVALNARDATGFVSDGMVEGALQVSGSGQLIVPLADCQTIGGYPKIATIASVDLRRFVQSANTTDISFAIVSMDQAQAEMAHYRLLMSALASTVRDVPSGGETSGRDAWKLASVSDNAVSAIDGGTWGETSIQAAS